MRSALQLVLVLSILACSEAPSSTPGASGAAGAASGPFGSSGAAGTGTAGSESSRAGSPTNATTGGSSGSDGIGTSGSFGQGTAGTGGGTASGGSGSACVAELTASNRALVATALDALFVEKQVSAIDQYWAEPYLQHNPVAKSGVAAFKSIMGSLVTSPSFYFERLRIVAECELVVVQGRYSGSGVVFDMFRVKDERLVEHWDSDANQASDASGPTENTSTPATSANRERVLAFIQAVLIEAQHGDASQFLSPGYVEHRTTAADGPAALTEYITTESISYAKIHHVIADGSFVFSLSEGTVDGAAHGFYDLFRLESGQIVEHWDSRRRVPASTMSGLGIF